jgi:RNA polymerase sigma-70 factor (ECF subfamily)
VLHDDLYSQTDRFAKGIIRRKVRQLIGRAGFTRQDREDLEQELALRLVQRLPLFDPGRAHRNVFITTVIERCVANILRDKQAGKRDYRRMRSLNVPVDAGDEASTELANAIGAHEHDARCGRSPRNQEELAQLVNDVAEVLTRLPAELRGLVERLKSQSISEIARDQGVPRTTLYASIRRLRQHFEKAGLKDYLHSRSSPRQATG